MSSELHKPHIRRLGQLCDTFYAREKSKNINMYINIEINIRNI